jgi:putative Ca2+/H+ antiporter (TMEM165/GDT1 family)
MDWKLLLTAFSTLFLAEFGDKTQLAVVTLAASTRKPWPVFFGAVAALAAVTGLGVLFGEGAARWVPEAWLRRGAATLFIGIGVWMWARP